MTMQLTYPPTEPLSGPVAGARRRFLPHVIPRLGRATHWPARLLPGCRAVLREEAEACLATR